MEQRVKNILVESLTDTFMEAGLTQTQSSLAASLGSSEQELMTLLTSTLVSGMNVLKTVVTGISVNSIRDSVFEALEMGDGSVDLVYAAAQAMQQEVIRAIDQLVQDCKDG